MIAFFKDSFKEIQHVIWPTPAETKKYFFIVVSILIIFGLYIFIASTLFTNLILILKDIFKNFI